MPQFTLRSMLGLTAFAAIALLSLVQPATLWFTFWPMFFSGLCMVVFIRAAVIRRDTAFWMSFIIGLSAFLMMSLFIGLFSALIGNEPHQAAFAVDFWFWALIRSDVPVVLNRPSGVPTELVSFAISLHIIIAMVWSGVVTFLGQILFRKREP